MVQNAERSRYLEGDIRLSQQYAGLERQGLDLQQKQLDINQDMINFNKKMLVANTIIQGTQAAVSLTNAAVNLGKTIGDIHNQRADLKIQTGVMAYEEELYKAITDTDSGYDPYEYLKDENGNPIIGDDGRQKTRYVRYDGYKLVDGRTLGDLKNQVIESVGKEYWTDSGRERGMQIATNAFEKITLEELIKASHQAKIDQQNLYDQVLTNFKTLDDLEGGIDYINSVPGLTPKQREAEVLKYTREVNENRVKNETMAIVRTKGIDAAGSYLDGLVNAEGKPLFNEKEKSEILAGAQNVNVQEMAKAATAAKDMYTQSKNNEETIGDAYRAVKAEANRSENPDVRDAALKGPATQHRKDLSERYAHLLENDDPRQALRMLENWHGDYEDEEELYNSQREQLRGRIAQAEALEARRAGGSDKEITDAAVKGKLKELLTEVLAGRGGEFGSVYDFNRKFKSMLYDWAYESGVYGGSQEKFEAQFAGVLEQFWDFARETVAESPEALSAINMCKKYFDTLDGTRPDSTLFMGKKYEGVTGHTRGEVTSGLYDLIYAYDNRDPKRSGQVFLDGVRDMLGVISMETVKALGETGKSGDKTLIDVVKTLENPSIMHTDNLGRLVTMPGPVDDPEKVRREVQNAWNMLGGRIARLQGLDPEKLVAHPREDVLNYEKDAAPEFQYDGGDAWYRLKVEGEGKNEQLILESRNGVNGKWGSPTALDNKTEDKAAAKEYKEYEKDREAQDEADNREASRLAGLSGGGNPLPMPEGYRGRVDDKMTRQEFIKKYGVNKYREFLEDWYKARGRALPEGLR
ncbi:MAG: hypothetical protein LBB81_01300 [Treponema sp.]|nr:hypothetical protein [Treponema sp.]